MEIKKEVTYSVRLTTIEMSTIINSLYHASQDRGSLGQSDEEFDAAKRMYSELQKSA